MPAIELDAANLDLSVFIEPNDTVIWTQGTGEPETLTKALADQREHLGGIRAFLGSCFSDNIRPEHADHIQFVGMGAIGKTRSFVKAGVLGIIPMHLTGITELFRTGQFKIDVVMLQASERSDGELSYGAANSYLPDAIKHASVVIAEINDQAPWTHSVTALPRDKVDYIVRTSRPLLEVPSRGPTEIDMRIAERVTSYIPDGSILQIGIGSLTDAVASCLSSHRDLGLHSGIIGDGCLDLIEAGVINNVTKPIDTGVSVTGGLFGTERLFRFANGNSAIRVDPVSHTHALSVIGQFNRFVTVNSAIEVDLTGQINSEVAGGNYIGSIGGQTDLVRGAVASPNGRSLVVLPSRLGADGPSRIVSRLMGGVTSAARADADTVITEYGAAELRGKTIGERVRAMIAIAHPDIREDLERSAYNETFGVENLSAH